MTKRGAGRRILLLGSYAPSLVNFRGPLIAEMAARGHEVLAAAPDLDAETRTALSRLGAEPVEIPMQRTGMNPFSDLGLCFRLRRLVRQRQVDTLIAYTMKPVIWGGIAARLAGTGTFAPMITGLGYGLTGAPSPKQRLVRALMTRLLRLALGPARVVFIQNTDDRDFLHESGALPRGTPVRLIAGSGIDLDRFPARPLPEKPAFLMIARLLGAKGVREYAEAVRRLKRSFPDVPCRLVGWIDESADAVGADELAAWQADGLEYLGFREDVRPTLAGAAVYVLPSYREGTPRSVLEAMATGRAVITTDAPGCRETVADGVNGRLVPVGDAGALLAAMTSYLEQPELAARHGAESRRMAEERFDVRRVNGDIVAELGL